MLALFVLTVIVLAACTADLFWDYDDDKQSKVMQVLQRREEVTGGRLGLASDADQIDSDREDNPINP